MKVIALLMGVLMIFGISSKYTKETSSKHEVILNHAFAALWLLCAVALIYFAVSVP